MTSDQKFRRLAFLPPEVCRASAEHVQISICAPAPFRAGSSITQKEDALGFVMTGKCEKGRG